MTTMTTTPIKGKPKKAWQRTVSPNPRKVDFEQWHEYISQHSGITRGQIAAKFGIHVGYLGQLFEDFLRRYPQDADHIRVGHSRFSPLELEAVHKSISDEILPRAESRQELYQEVQDRFGVARITALRLVKVCEKQSA